MIKDLAKAFFSFDALMGEDLVKTAFYAGLAIIGFVMLGEIFGAVDDGFWRFLGALIVAPVKAAIALVIWRFMCEAAIALFRINDRVDRQSPQTDAGDDAA